MFALIHKRAPNAMQSGTKAQKWVIGFPSKNVRTLDPLTGMSGTMDMLSELNLSFDSKDAAIAYAKANNIAFTVAERARHEPKGRSYGDNFSFDRKFPWTH